WGLLTPVVILGGIYGGIFTPTEAAGIAIVYAFIVGVFIYKEITFKNMGKLFVDAAVMSATVMFIIAFASIFAWLLMTSHIATDVSSGLLSISGNNKIIVLIMMNIIFLIAGCFLDANSACYILVPVLIPVCAAMQIDLIHFGVFMTVNLAIGLVTPPVGVNLYVGASILKLPVIDVCKKMAPFIIAGIIALGFITYIPQITMFMANLVNVR
ncbi:MAG: TRAP transporter large permease subunit, partial [Elusimicrobiota bacterium]|nr:TRAP transporter large permease subunit [Elusimicrobiota bacterium]